MAVLRSAARPRLLLIAPCWLAVVLIFAVQWYVYDLARGDADLFRSYLWWSFYTWGVLTPLVVKFAHAHPINSSTWKRTLPLHLAASCVLVVAEISIEAMIGKLRFHHHLSMQEALRHYFMRHTQISLFTYWMLVGAVQFYRMLDESRRRELRSSKLESQLAAAQLEALRAQIQPHFLFNTLQAATTLIHEDPEGAEDILLRLSELLRLSVDESHVQEITLERELQVLDLYIGIQARRFGDRLRFKISVDENVRDCMIPALILQPLVENAVRHGIGKHKGADTISIRGSKRDGRLLLEVLNTNSRLEEDPLLSAGSGVGLANTRARLEQLYGSRQQLRLVKLEPTGVCARISIPFRTAPVLAAEAS
jgi:two-component system, LytTR family, sensor kinase